MGPAEIRTATSLVREGRYEPDFYALGTDSVVVFPWDREVLDSEALRLVVNPEYEDLLEDSEG